MKQIETMLDEWLVKKAPFQLPENGRKGLVKAMPWIALVGGLLCLFGVFALWRLATFTDSIVSYANQVNSLYGAPVATVAGTNMLVWLSLIVLAVQGVMFVAAFAGLKTQKKSGWNLLFWVALLNVAYAVVYLFVNQSIVSLLFSLIETVVGLYLLFQIRSYYVASPAPAKKK